jgi:hypothetical protein
VRQLALREVALAAHTEHDLEVAFIPELPDRRVREKVEELHRLVGAGGDPQRFEREARVPDPGVAIVPVAAAADRLRQRRGWRGDDSAGRLVREPLKNPSAHPYQLRPRAPVSLVESRPAPPGPACLL